MRVREIYGEWFTYYAVIDADGYRVNEFDTREEAEEWIAKHEGKSCE